ncbi:hypothetical protein B296_00009079 [Ensete ventricosum]|uniref:Uncharacterized protein n=1 Tax=Ensete ventricosum TaxID=4639 RepID=A0A427B1I1_ENSVE|nr:hypothetical protein B296_00009079 [Ensete ventricosum]
MDTKLNAVLTQLPTRAPPMGRLGAMVTRSSMSASTTSAGDQPKPRFLSRSGNVLPPQSADIVAKTGLQTIADPVNSLVRPVPLPCRLPTALASKHSSSSVTSKLFTAEPNPRL